MTISNHWYGLPSLIVACLASRVTADISCQDDNGQPVDWFIVYKLPKDVDGSGINYKYMDHGTSGWRTGRYTVNSTQGAVGATLQQLYGQSQSNNVAFVLYNDQSPIESSSDGGHTKGVVLLDQTQGFWLVHSTPHFPPPAQESYQWPSSGRRYGQSFLCVTYPYSQFQEIGTQLLYNSPHVFDHSIPPSFAKDLPDLQRAAAGEHKKTPPWARKVVLSSAAGKQFTSFAKHKNFGADLYKDWVADVFQSDLFVQSWLNCRRALPSNCSGQYAVYNVEGILFPKGAAFSTHVDHSKWCMTRPGGGSSWTCIGDINRDQAQEERGGGTVCNDDPAVWDAFSILVVSCQICKCTCSGNA
ncbi:deoxyribonuclease-2-alpha-like [Amblyraja radiata]|uniref:deoxyribonuclease-2-alpha-like n=1 Tax=Amblyraja radiata TaxID=386614 RepID=UPI001401F3F1|nr:deoxyribonuclease-2-alpha-like [Amblyraja radiata]